MGDPRDAHGLGETRIGFSRLVALTEHAGRVFDLVEVKCRQ